MWNSLRWVLLRFHHGYLSVWTGRLCTPPVLQDGQIFANMSHLYIIFYFCWIQLKVRRGNFLWGQASHKSHTLASFPATRLLLWFGFSCHLPLMIPAPPPLLLLSTLCPWTHIQTCLIWEIMNLQTLSVQPTLYSSIVSLKGTSKHLKAQWDKALKYPLWTFFTWSLWPLTYGLDLQIWPGYFFTWSPCQNLRLYICLVGCECGKRHIDTHTDRRCQIYCTCHITDKGCN